MAASDIETARLSYRAASAACLARVEFIERRIRPSFWGRKPPEADLDLIGKAAAVLAVTEQPFETREELDRAVCIAMGWEEPPPATP